MATRGVTIIPGKSVRNSDGSITYNAGTSSQYTSTAPKSSSKGVTSGSAPTSAKVTNLQQLAQTIGATNAMPKLGVSDVMESASATYDKKQSSGGYGSSNNAVRDYFNQSDNYNEEVNKLSKGGDSFDKEVISDMINKKSGSSGTIRKLTEEGYYTNENLSNNDNLKYIKAQQVYEDQVDKAREAYQSAYNSEIAEIARQEELARQQAEEANRLAYIQRMLGSKNLNQALASQGINGGASESALLQLASNYGNQVATNQQNLINALSGYSNDRLKASSTMNQGIANARTNADTNIENALQTLLGGQTTTKTTTFDVDKALKTKSALEEAGLDTSVVDKELADNGYVPVKTKANEVKVAETEETTQEVDKKDSKETYKEANVGIRKLIQQGLAKEDVLNYLDEINTTFGLTESDYKKLKQTIENSYKVSRF